MIYQIAVRTIHRIYAKLAVSGRCTSFEAPDCRASKVRPLKPTQRYARATAPIHPLLPIMAKTQVATRRSSRETRVRSLPVRGAPVDRSRGPTAQGWALACGAARAHSIEEQLARPCGVAQSLFVAYRLGKFEREEKVLRRTVVPRSHAGRRRNSVESRIDLNRTKRRRRKPREVGATSPVRKEGPSRAS